MILLLCVVWIVGTAADSMVGSMCDMPLEKIPCNVLHRVMEKDGMFTIKRETLENNCTEILGSFNCLRSHWAECSPGSFSDLSIYISGLERTMVDLCNNETRVRKDYERHIPCISDVSRKLQNCTSVAEQKVRILRKENPDLKSLSTDASSCLTHIELVGCVESVAGHQCGPDAGQLIGELVEWSFQPYRHLKCDLMDQLSVV